MYYKMNNLDKWFLLSWKKVAIILIAWIASVILHNIIYVIFIDYFNSTPGGDEPFFFLIAIIIIPIYLVVLIIYTIISKLKTP